MLIEKCINGGISGIVGMGKRFKDMKVVLILKKDLSAFRRSKMVARVGCSMSPETSLRCQSYTWVILIAPSQNNNNHHIRCRYNSKTDLKLAFN
jgi:hypothetical protein